MSKMLRLMLIIIFGVTTTLLITGTMIFIGIENNVYYVFTGVPVYLLTMWVSDRLNKEK